MRFGGTRTRLLRIQITAVLRQLCSRSRCQLSGEFQPVPLHLHSLALAGMTTSMPICILFRTADPIRGDATAPG